MNLSSKNHAKKHNLTSTNDHDVSDLTAAEVIRINNAGSAVETISAGTSGYVLTSNGTGTGATFQSLQKVLNIPVSDDTTANTVVNGAGDFTITIDASLNGWNLVSAHASVEVAGTTGTQDIQIHNVTQAADMLSTEITIDSGELTSYTAATAPVVDTANDDVSTGDKIRIDVDAIHTTPANGLAVILTFELP